MKIMDAIGKGFGLAGKNIGLLAILFAFNTVWNLVTLPFMGQAANASAAAISPPLAIAGVVFLVFNIFVQGGVFGVLKDALGSEGRANLANFARYGQKFYLKFMGGGAFIIGLLIAAVLVAGFLFSLAMAIKFVAVKVIGVALVIALIVAALYYLFLLFLSPYILVVEDVGVFKAMANSMRFTKARFFKISWLLTLLVLIGLGMAFGAGALTSVIFLAVKGTAFQVITAVVSSAINAYITVIISAALMFYYTALSGTSQQKSEA